MLKKMRLSNQFFNKLIKVTLIPSILFIIFKISILTDYLNNSENLFLSLINETLLVAAIWAISLNLLNLTDSRIFFSEVIKKITRSFLFLYGFILIIVKINSILGIPHVIIEQFINLTKTPGFDVIICCSIFVEIFSNKKQINKYQVFNLFNKRAFTILLIGLIIYISVFLRVQTLEYIDGLDNFTALAMKNLYENGFSYYKDSLTLITMNYIAMHYIGYTQTSLRIFQVFYSAIALFIIFLITYKYSKSLSIYAGVLFALSPWSIILSRVQRDYSFDFMMSAIIFYFTDKIRSSNKKLITKIFLLSILCITSATAFIFNRRTQTVISVIFPASAILYLIISSNFFEFKNIKFKINIIIKFLVLIFSSIIIYFFSYGAFFSKA